jgi:hypothetical protein
MPKSSKRFVIVSNQVNNYGYRVDTAGMDVTQFEKNPTLLDMHQRGNVLGHWQDVQREPNGDITAVPYFTDATQRAKEVYAMVEDGSYRMCSAGFTPVATSSAPEDVMPGQVYETITKSKLVEASIVDVGADDNALALYHNSDLLLLDGSNDTSKIIPIINQTNNLQMKEHLIPLLTLMGLQATGTMDQLIQSINDLKTNADTAKAQLQQKEDTIVTLNDTIATLQQAATTAAVDAVIDAAVAERKITEAQKPFYKQMGETNLENLKQLMATIPATPTLGSHIAPGADGTDPLLQLSYDEAHRTDKLAEIKTKYPAQYKQLFKAKHGREPQA